MLCVSSTDEVSRGKKYNFKDYILRIDKGWQKLFESAWKTFDTQFRTILDSLDRHKALIESEKGTLAIGEARKAREIAEDHSTRAVERERKDRLRLLVERLKPADYARDQHAALKEWRRSQSGQWLWQHQDFQLWSDLNAKCNPLLYLHGIPGAGKCSLDFLTFEN